MQPISKRPWLRRLLQLKERTFENPFLAATFICGSIGGLTLFWYSVLIGQVPNFAFSEVLGTFVATCLAGVFVIGMLSVMCIAPGAFSRYVLDEILPERPSFKNFLLPDKRTTEPAVQVTSKMREQLLKGAFPVEISLLAVLAWSLIWLTPLSQFLWPADVVLLKLLYGFSLTSLVITVCFGSYLPRWALIFFRYIVVFSALTASLLYLVNRLDLPSPGRLFPANTTPSSTTGTRALYIHTWTIPSGFLFYGIVVSVTLVLMGVLEICRRRGSRLRRARQDKTPDEQARAYPSVIWVRTRVAAAYVAASVLPMLAALKLAGENGPTHAVRSLAMLVLYLVLLNFLHFCLASVKQNFSKAAMLAVLFLAAILIIPVQLLTLVPKTVVFVLGLGNFHSSAVVLPGSECSRLKVYGVLCNSKKDESITIANVNVISLLGSNAVLELQIRREGPLYDADRKETGGGHDADLDISDGLAIAKPIMPAQAGRLTSTILRAGISDSDATTGAGNQVLRRARQCDAGTAAWLHEPGGSKAHQEAMREKNRRLLCVVFTVQKTELLDYDKEGWRSYQNGYSTFVESVPPATNSEKSPVPPSNG